MALQAEAAVLRNTRDRHFLDEVDNTEIYVELNCNTTPGKITDINLCAVLFDYEGNLYDTVHFNRKEINGIKLDNAKLQQQRLSLSLADMPPLATLAFFFLTCSAGTELKDLLDDSKAQVYANTLQGAASGGSPRKLLYSLPLTQKSTSLLSHSASVVICRLFKNESSEWEVMAVGQVSDLGVRYAQVLPTLVDYFPPSFKVDLSAAELRFLIKKAAASGTTTGGLKVGGVDYAHEPLVNSKVDIVGAKTGGAVGGNATVTFGLGWEALFGKIRSKYYLEANIVCFGRYGAKLDLVDAIVKQSRDKSISLDAKMYKQVGRSDETVRVDLSRVASNVHTILFVAIASSSTSDAGFSLMNAPYVRMSYESAAGQTQDLYRLAVADRYMKDDSKEKSVIAAKLVRDVLEPAKWSFVPITEYSSGIHAVYDESLAEQIDKHVERVDAPDSELLEAPASASAPMPSFSLKYSSGFSMDFSSMGNTDTVHVIQFNQEGKEMTPVLSKTFKDGLQSEPLFSLRMASEYRQQIDTRTLRYDLRDVADAGIHAMLWVASPYSDLEALKPPAGSGEAIVDWLTVYDKDEGTELFTTEFGTINKPTILAALVRNAAGEWTWRRIGLPVPVPLKGSVSLARFLRAVRGPIRNEFANSSTSKQLQAGQKLSISTSEAEHLLVGFGIEGSSDAWLNGTSTQKRFKHRVRGEAEIYDVFSWFHGIIYNGRCDAKNARFFGRKDLYTSATADDEEQITIARHEITQVRYWAFNIDAKSRALITDQDKLYARVCDRHTAKEICRVSIPGSLLTKGYAAGKGKLGASAAAAASAEDDGLSDTESDAGSVSGTSVTMFVVKQTLDGWQVQAVAKHVDDPTAEFMDPQPKKLEVSIIGARDLAQVDLSPMVKIKLTEKKAKQGLLKKKKQKFRTQAKKKTDHPDWNEKFEFQIFHPDDIFTIVVVDSADAKADVGQLGKIDVTARLALASEGMQREFKLRTKNYPGAESYVTVKFRRM